MAEKYPRTVVRAIRTVHSGKRLMPQEVAERLSEYFPQVALTPREVEVLGCVAKGMDGAASTARAYHDSARAKSPLK